MKKTITWLQGLNTATIEIKGKDAEQLANVLAIALSKMYDYDKSKGYKRCAEDDYKLFEQFAEYGDELSTSNK